MKKFILIFSLLICMPAMAETIIVCGEYEGLRG